MLEIKEKGILENTIHFCLRIEEKMKGVTRQMFDNNEDLKEIVCYNIFQIGEIAKKLSSEFIKKYNEVPWKDIKGMRDWVGHGYCTIDWNTVWETAFNEIIRLRKYCELILKENK